MGEAFYYWVKIKILRLGYLFVSFSFSFSFFLSFSLSPFFWFFGLLIRFTLDYYLFIFILLPSFFCTPFFKNWQPISYLEQRKGGEKLNIAYMLCQSMYSCCMHFFGRNMVSDFVIRGMFVMFLLFICKAFWQLVLNLEFEFFFHRCCTMSWRTISAIWEKNYFGFA